VPSALVTGATGLVGSHVVARLLADGWSVRALVRARVPEPRGVEQRVGDVLDPAAFASAAAGVDVVFHAAAAITPRGGWEAFRRLNVDGTRNAVDAAVASRARLVHVSSVAVYGSGGRYAAGGGKTSEDTPLGPLPERAYYARSKRESEQIVLDAHRAGRVWSTALRPDVIYGPRDRQFVPRLARLLDRGFAPVIGGGVTTLAVVHAANVADGVVRAATNTAAGGRAFNLANDFDVTVAEFFRLAAEGLGRRVRLVNIPLPVARSLFRAVRIGARLLTGGRSSVVSNSSLGFVTRDNPFTSERARRELGWSPSVHPSRGVPDAFRWWRAHRAASDASS
jgi:nucleoside-diphosphate-sugar epimerase